MHSRSLVISGAANELAEKYEQLGSPCAQVTPVRGGLPLVMWKFETRSAVCPEPFAFRLPLARHCKRHTAHRADDRIH